MIGIFLKTVTTMTTIIIIWTTLMVIHYQVIYPPATYHQVTHHQRIFIRRNYHESKYGCCIGLFGQLVMRSGTVTTIKTQNNNIQFKIYLYL